MLIKKIGLEITITICLAILYSLCFISCSRSDANDKVISEDNNSKGRGDLAKECINHFQNLTSYQQTINTIITDNENDCRKAVRLLNDYANELGGNYNDTIKRIGVLAKKIEYADRKKIIDKEAMEYETLFKEFARIRESLKGKWDDYCIEELSKVLMMIDR